MVQVAVVFYLCFIQGSSDSESIIREDGDVDVLSTMDLWCLYGGQVMLYANTLGFVHNGVFLFWADYVSHLDRLVTVFVL
jgi:hypothetical protein